MNLPKSVLFDLDDTILAYEAESERCWQQVCLSFAPFVSGLEVDTLAACIEEVRSWYWETSSEIAVEGWIYLLLDGK